MSLFLSSALVLPANGHVAFVSWESNTVSPPAPNEFQQEIYEIINTTDPALLNLDQQD